MIVYCSIACLRHSCYFLGEIALSWAIVPPSSSSPRPFFALVVLCIKSIITSSSTCIMGRDQSSNALDLCIFLCSFRRREQELSTLLCSLGNWAENSLHLVYEDIESIFIMVPITCVKILALKLHHVAQRNRNQPSLMCRVVWRCLGAQGSTTTFIYFWWSSQLFPRADVVIVIRFSL